MLFTGLNCTPVETLDRRVLVDPIPHGFSPPMGQQAHFDPPVSEPDMDVEVAPMVPIAQSAPNEQWEP